MCGWKAACVPLPAGAPPSEAAIQLRAQGVATARAAANPFAGVCVATGAKRHRQRALQPGAVVPPGVPELQVNTTLQGMALDLPAPWARRPTPSSPCAMNKWWRANPWCPLPPGPPPPLRDQVTLDLGSIGSATYLRDLAGAQPRVLRGSMGVGLSAGESAPVVAEGVAANIRLGRVDVDAWERLLTSPPRTRQCCGGAAGGARPAPPP